MGLIGVDHSARSDDSIFPHRIIQLHRIIHTRPRVRIINSSELNRRSLQWEHPVTTETTVPKTVLGMLLIVALVSTALDGCGSDSKKTENTFDYYQQDPDTYTVDPDPDRLVTSPQGNRFPTDQLLLLLAEGATPDQARQAAQNLGGTVVGQIPAVRIYQLQFSTTTEEELQALFSLAADEPSVEAVSFNLEGVPQQGCMPNNDNDANLNGLERCPFTDIQYYQTLTLFEEIRSDLTLHDVSVAVIDTGLDASSGEFDDVDILNLWDPSVAPADSFTKPHGTYVSSVIAADNNGQATNGIASRFLGDHLKLLIGGDPVFTLGFFMSLALKYTKTASDEGRANIVNISQSFPSCDATTFDTCNDGPMRLWENVFKTYNDVLFVISAPNTSSMAFPNHPLDPLVQTPAGIQLANVITVGGTAHCDPLTLSNYSAHGPRVEIVAPSEEVPVFWAFSSSLDATRLWGNSYAAPQVASAAAILLSVDPALTPVEIKSLLVDHGPEATGAHGYTYPRLDMYEPLAVHLLTRVPISEETRRLLDPKELGYPDMLGHVIYRICGGLDLEVEDFSFHEYTDPNSTIIDPMDPYAVGAVQGVTQSFELKSLFPDGAWVRVACSNCEFRLEQEYEMTDTITASHTDGVAAMEYYSDYLSTDAPYGESFYGTLSFDSCRINERDDINNLPSSFTVAGSFQGDIELHISSEQTEIHPFTSYFVIDFQTFCIMEPEAEYCAYLDAVCEGGLNLD